MESSDPRPKRKHGGKRAGSGRKAGGANALPLGVVRTIKSLKHRVPEGTPDELADAAGEALELLASVMRGEVYDSSQAQARLRAAAMFREEVCGKVADKLQHAGEDGGPVRVSFNINRPVKK